MAILDADKEGYLRSGTSLIQTAGRAARNVKGEVIMYADRVTGSMSTMRQETDRRREIQTAYNTAHGITPESIKSSIREILNTIYERDYYTVEVTAPAEPAITDPAAREARIKELEARMKEAARRLDFEQAAELRDQIKGLRKRELVS